MRDQRVYLKVKIKSLAAEAVIIRIEERKNKHFQNGLAAHRRTVVRNESRHALLAYGFLLGRQYTHMERDAASKPDWEKVKKMIDKHGVCWDSDVSWSELRAAKQQQATRFEAWKPVLDVK